MPRASTTAPCSTTRCSACSTASPSSRRSASCRSACQRLQPRAAHAAAHGRRGGRRGRHRRPTGRTRSTSRRSAAGSCSPPTSTTCWPAGRSRRRPTTTSFPQHENGIGMARTFEAEVAGAGGPDRTPRPTATAAASSRSVDGAPRGGLPAPRRRRAMPSTSPTGRSGDARPAAAHRAPAGRPGRRPDRPLRGPGARAARGGPRPARRPARARRQPLLRRQHRGHRACWSARTSPACSRPSPRATATCCPTCASSEGAFLDGTAPADLPRPVEVVADRRRRPAALRSRCRPGRELTVALPVVAIVGRPNVGKSTLVNRIVGRRAAIVEEQPGRHPRPQGGRGRLARPPVPARRHRRLAGRAAATSTPRSAAQAERAIADADVVLFVVDVAVGITEEDARVADLLRRSGKPVLVVANKVDDTSRETDDLGAHDASGSASPARSARCTAGGPATCSTRSSTCCRRRRRRDRRRRGRRRRPRRRRRGRRRRRSVAVAIVGRPNVGQVDAVQPARSARTAPSSTTCRAPPATRSTRSSRPTDGPIRFVDTAGHAPPEPQIDEGTEYYSLVRALAGGRPRRRGAPRDRRHRGRHPPGPAPGRAHRRRRLPDRRPAQQVGAARRRGQRPTSAGRSADQLHFLGDAPVLTISALTGKGVHKLLPGPGDQRRGLPPAGADRPRSTRSCGRPRRPSRRRAAPGSSTPPRARPTRRPSRCSPTASCRRTYLRYLERRLREAFDLGRHPDQAAGPAAR